MKNNFLNWRSSTPLNTTPEGWMIQIIDESSLQNNSNQINWRKSQISVLYIKFPVFLGFFSLESNIWKRLWRSKKKYRESLTLFLECQSRMSITFECIFSGEDRLWFFWRKGNIISVTFIHIYRKHLISMYFLRKIIFHFLSKENNSYFWIKKIPSF